MEGSGCDVRPRGTGGEARERAPRARREAHPPHVPGECPPPWAGHTLRPFSSRTDCGLSTAPYLGLRFAFGLKVKTLVKPVVLKAWEFGARPILSQTQKRQYFKVYVMEFLIFSISASAVFILRK